MMRTHALIAVAAAAMSLAGWSAQASEHAQQLAAPTGDPAAGETQWRQCRACHMITSPDGEEIQRGGRVGPNLWGVVGSQAGADEDFRFSAELAEAGEEGLIWDEENFVAYVQDPTGFIRAHTDNPRARSPMNFQMRQGAEDMYAYLAQFGGDHDDDDDNDD
jgi:cytochrome c